MTKVVEVIDWMCRGKQERMPAGWSRQVCGEEGRKEISRDVARRCRAVCRLQGSGPW